MSKWRKKPIVIEATQWFKNGDHPKDGKGTFVDAFTGKEHPKEGKVVRYYRNPTDDGSRVCDSCKNDMHSHGWVDTLEGRHIRVSW